MIINLSDIKSEEIKELSKGLCLHRLSVTDSFGRMVNILCVDNGILKYEILLERAMDIGEIFFKGKKISWDKEKERLIHPDSIDLKEDGAWERGFYASVASLGPEVFGTPDEIRTPHGTGAFSKADLSSVKIEVDDERIVVKGIVAIRGYSKDTEYIKEVSISTYAGAHFFEREELYINKTDGALPLDDGYHIQFCGDFLYGGGRYVLPVSNEKMLLRDSAPIEDNPKAVYAKEQVLDPIRCYQYVPEKVYGISAIREFSKSLVCENENEDKTCEALVNADNTLMACVVRPLSSFSRTLLAKRCKDDFMYAIEPCKTRPNSIKQKAIDGELQYIYPKKPVKSKIMFGFLDDETSIKTVTEFIERAADYEKEISEKYR